MNPQSAASARAMWLLRNEIYAQLDECEFLAMSDDEWDDEEEAAARGLLCDLVTVVRTVVGDHREDAQGRCKLCEKLWPCDSIDSVHRSMHAPDAGFAKLLEQR
ncbi:hypothetical protein [Amycolatopsis sp. CA-230715]|uniref:hypothetical protein n=1 Tax=Amycolatopsis sp. CA-230715 TaxID=2745196 RepID=UPI001C019426|nr:hypothetical protein [Amycolatopsis sp. CA-230715]QWF82300.1 hypothetical protein HUW46_05737 [Amycolatopsis sp. CA-230715]